MSLSAKNSHGKMISGFPLTIEKYSGAAQ